jgi:hypothetical protein
MWKIDYFFQQVHLLALNFTRIFEF